MREIKLTPFAPNLVESTRSIGYSFETAMADIIDNSISNLASRVDVLFDDNEENPYIAIIDDGTGMSAKTLQQAMRYGSTSTLEERAENDLGRFGLGLKMASMSQCRKLTVISKQRNKINAVCWDLDHIHKTSEWSLIVYSDEQIKQLKHYDTLENYKSGTIVLWEKLDRISESEIHFSKEFNQKLDFADRHLGLVFHRYLENKLSNNYFELYFNNRLVEPIDPFITSNKATQPLEEETIFINKVPIQIKPFIIPYTSKLSAEERSVQNSYNDLNLKQGLYIYRNKRLIVWGKWFHLLRDSELNRLARVRIDLPNSIDDVWTIDVKKSNATIPSSIKDALKNIIIRAVGRSEKVYRYRGRKANQTSYEHIWNRISNRDNIQYVINRDIPMFKALENSLNDEQSRLFESFINSVEDGFPYTGVYYDLAKDRNIEENTLSLEEAYDMAKNVIDSFGDNVEAKRQQLEVFQKIDIFQKYPSVLTMIEEELNK